MTLQALKTAIFKPLYLGESYTYTSKESPEYRNMDGFRQNDLHFATKACHSGQEPEQWSSMAVVPVISMSTTFKQYGPADPKA